MAFTNEPLEFLDELLPPEERERLAGLIVNWVKELASQGRLIKYPDEPHSVVWWHIQAIVKTAGENQDHVYAGALHLVNTGLFKITDWSDRHFYVSEDILNDVAIVA